MKLLSNTLGNVICLYIYTGKHPKEIQGMQGWDCQYTHPLQNDFLEINTLREFSESNQLFGN